MVQNWLSRVVPVMLPLDSSPRSARVTRLRLSTSTFILKTVSQLVPSKTAKDGSLTSKILELLSYETSGSLNQ